ncbi:MAG: deoxyribodipyrimidine photo-lyase [Acidimicrobiia bacterium]|nr:deoxyribodipyrimidine photo-lyase [Acidimicrobiia bacterium]
MSGGGVAVVWFRRDLRLSDNPALLEAVRAADEVVPLFVLDERLRKPSGPNRLAFLAGCLRELHDATDGHLVIRKGAPATKVRALAREVEATAVYCAEDFGPYGSKRDEEVAEALEQDGCELRRVGSPYAVPPGEVLNKSGDNFKVFTPYSRAWRAHGWEAPSDKPRSITWASGVASDDLPAAPETDADLPAPGEQAGHRRLDAFLDGHIQDYAEERNRPGEDGTSRLSPYLKWGCLHPRQLLDRLGKSKGEQTFMTELCWRDFYADVLFHRPDSARRAFNPAMRKMKIDSGKRADERFTKWCDGRTGFPIVDAGMRQLRAEGWMHNRVRMIVASFLVKDLHVDWTRGAAWFMHNLVDGDLASNQHGWQWTAGTGTDPAPYFRVFNPVSQSKKFDPDGRYIRRWVPELAKIEGAAIHEPWTAAQDLFGGPDGYPDPIVDHAAEREEALRRYGQLRS